MKRSILIIEREADSTTVLRTALQDLQYHIYQNDSIEASQKLMLSFIPDVVICNVINESETKVLELVQFLHASSIRYFIILSASQRGLYTKISAFHPLAVFTDKADPFAIEYLVGAIDFEKTSPLDRDKVLSIKQGTNYRMLPYDDILYCIATGNGVTIVTKDEEIQLSSSLKSIMRGVEEASFIRIHRNYMVNISKISKYESANSHIYLGDIQLPAGRIYKSKVSKIFKKMSSAKV